jgi:EAL domain-containing protein (putative c-di-GMP-specific phosphodiesterase class I)
VPSVSPEWSGIDSRISNRRTAIHDLKAVLEDNRTLAYYQPVARVDTREIIGLEALCRLGTNSDTIVAAAAFQDATSMRASPQLSPAG